MAQGLRERLIGAWKLESYVEKPVDGSAPFYPMGERGKNMSRQVSQLPQGFVSPRELGLIAGVLTPQVLGQPALVEPGDIEVVHFKHLHVPVSMDAHGRQVDPFVRDARLRQEFGRAVIVSRVIRRFAGGNKDRNTVQPGQRVSRLGLQPATLQIGIGGRHPNEAEICGSRDRGREVQADVAQTTCARVGVLSCCAVDWFGFDRYLIGKGKGAKQRGATTRGSLAF